MAVERSPFLSGFRFPVSGFRVLPCLLRSAFRVPSSALPLPPRVLHKSLRRHGLRRGPSKDAKPPPEAFDRSPNACYTTVGNPAVGLPHYWKHCLVTSCFSPHPGRRGRDQVLELSRLFVVRHLVRRSLGDLSGEAQRAKSEGGSPTCPPKPAGRQYDGRLDQARRWRKGEGGMRIALLLREVAKCYLVANHENNCFV